MSVERELLEQYKSVYEFLMHMYKQTGKETYLEEATMVETRIIYMDGEVL